MDHVNVVEVDVAVNTLSFEEAFSQLEKIIQQMDSAEVKLEDSVKLYEQGIALKKVCEEKLQSARLKIEKITLSPTGETLTQPFNPEDN
ncbi:MAG: exodeoxyribonuclease VII small subunit [Alphaproteobacteria bacterium]|nr:exodeoxyribonuclease VII small subunit [Alphaproteobacteria bacterium]